MFLLGAARHSVVKLVHITCITNSESRVQHAPSPPLPFTQRALTSSTQAFTPKNVLARMDIHGSEEIAKHLRDFIGTQSADELQELWRYWTGEICINLSRQVEHTEVILRLDAGSVALSDTQSFSCITCPNLARREGLMVTFYTPKRNENHHLHASTCAMTLKVPISLDWGQKSEEERTQWIGLMLERDINKRKQQYNAA